MPTRTYLEVAREGLRPQTPGMEHITPNPIGARKAVETPKSPPKKNMVPCLAAICDQKGRHCVHTEQMH